MHAIVTSAAQSLSFFFPTSLAPLHPTSTSTTTATSFYENRTTGNKGRAACASSSRTLPEQTHAAPAAAAPRPSPPRSSAAIAELKESRDLEGDLSRCGGKLQVQDLNIVLRHFGTLGKWSKVSQIFDWMHRHGKVNFASYSSFIKYMGKSQNPAKALEVYNSIIDDATRNNTSICNSVLGCVVKNGKFENSIKLFDQMKRRGLIPDLVTYSTLLAGCTKIKHGYSQAVQLVRELESSGLQMDSVIYGNLLAICASDNLCEEAEILFQQMKAEGLSPNLYHYSSLLNAYSIDGDYAKADNLFKEMKSAGLVPNKVILTTLLKVYVRGGLLEKSKELLAELEALGYAEDEMPYCLLMDNFAKAGRVDEAQEIFDEMLRKNIQSNGFSYSIMISAFCRTGLLEKAKQLSRDFEARYDKYDLVMLNTLLRAHCNTGDMESVMQLLRKMDELTITPDWNTFHILIKYFCREKLYHLAYKTVEDMHCKGCQLDEELCSSLITKLGQTGASAEAFAVYNMLRYSKRTVSKTLHGKMLNILVSAGLLKNAYVVMKDNAACISASSLERFAQSFMKLGNVNMINDVVKALHRAGFPISEEVLQAAITRYISKPEKKELLLQLLEWMPGHGYVVDSSSRNLLLKNAQLFGPKHLMAEILSKQHHMFKKLNLHDANRSMNLNIVNKSTST